MYNKIKRIWQKIAMLNLYLPRCCVFCSAYLNTQQEHICSGCVADFLSQRDYSVRCNQCSAVVEQGFCIECSSLAPAFDQSISALDYISPVDYWIMRYKQQHQTLLAPVFVYMLMQRLLLEHEVFLRKIYQQPTIIVPVPSNAQALLQRGFNPAALLANALARRLNLPIWHDVLHRYDGLPLKQGSTSEQMRQKILDAQSRRAATTGQYFCRKPVPASVILVDDVMTTGSTLDACARVLRQAGAQQVNGLVIARTPLPQHELPLWWQC